MVRALVLALALAFSVPAAALPISVVLVGDSITAGIVSGAEPGDPYAGLLADALGPDFAVSEIGCGGASSLDWTRSRGTPICGAEDRQLPNLYEARLLPELPADLVTILLGTNDALGYLEPDRVDPADYRDAIEEIVFDLLADGAGRVMLLTPPPNIGRPTERALLLGYRSEILDLCGSLEDVLCGPDVYTLLDADDFELANVHPNAAGHQKIADALQGAILAAVPEPATGTLVAIGLAGLAVRRRLPGGWPRPLRSPGC